MEVEISWVVVAGGEWSWVDVGARFSNTRFSSTISFSKFLNHFQLSLGDRLTKFCIQTLSKTGYTFVVEVV